MKLVKVSALRSKRGLRSRLGIAEPQVESISRLADTNPRNQPPSTNERKADTMSTYLLRNVSKVQPQPKPATAAVLPGGPVLFIGLDVHTDSIAVTVVHR